MSITGLLSFSNTQENVYGIRLCAGTRTVLFWMI